ncbi:MAG: glucose-6-phosphate isomerase [Deltaproteobacteria bacterium]|nr:glucose-6-phosphate isomerase [Deltaproteobacteria bacterium]
MSKFEKDGFLLIYDSVRVDLTKYEPISSDLLNFMDRLEAGELVNDSENRAVGHYWLRDWTRAPSNDVANDILEEIHKVATFFRSNDFSYLIYIGIGGSGLGPNLIYDCFSHRTRKKVIVIDNIDQEGIARKLSGVSLADTLVCVASKSGTTTETIVAKEIVKNLFGKMSLSFENHAIAITMQNTPLWKEADNWLSRFKLWDWVGGRTSIHGAVGLSVMDFMELNSNLFLEGAKFMDNLTRQTEVHQNPALIVCFALVDCFARGKKNLCVLPYSDRLELFSKYLQQLFMESLGKTREDGSLFGLTVFGNKGTTDQHSFVQQLRQGNDDFIAVFIRRLYPEITIDDSVLNHPIEKYFDSFLLGTREALTAAGREHLTLTVPRLDEFWLGALIALFERVVGFFARYYRINAYNQPGVEEGKWSSKKYLQLEENLKNIP